MRIIVCVKPVKSELVYDSPEEYPPVVLNPYDAFALNCAIDVKNQIQAEIICISMGPSSSEDSMVRTIAMGADHAILLTDEGFIGADTISTSYALSMCIRKLEADYIICGARSVDGETGQVPFGIAERLGYVSVPNVIRLSVRDHAITVDIKREKEIMEATVERGSLLVIDQLTVLQSNLSLLALKRARRQGIQKMTLHDIHADPALCGSRGSKTKVICMEKLSFERKHFQNQEAAPIHLKEFMRLLSDTM